MFQAAAVPLFPDLLNRGILYFSGHIEGSEIIYIFLNPILISDPSSWQLLLRRFFLPHMKYWPSSRDEMMRMTGQELLTH